MFSKYKRIMKLRAGKQSTDEEWQEDLARQGGLEKNDFAAMVIAAMLVILPVCAILLLALVAVCCLFLL